MPYAVSSCFAAPFARTVNFHTTLQRRARQHAPHRAQTMRDFSGAPQARNFAAKQTIQTNV
jgi:hypothetical protein